MGRRIHRTIGRRLTKGRYLGRSIPFPLDLLATYYSQTGNVINERSNNDGKLMPAVGNFEGTDDKITVPDASWMDFGVGNVTAHVKVKFNSIATSQFIYGRLLDGNNGSYIGWDQATGKFSFTAYSNFGVNNYRWFLSTTWTPTTGVWYDIFIVAGQTTGDSKIYINSTSKTLSTNTVNIYDFNITEDILIAQAGADYATINISTLEFYNRILTDQEITDYYNGTIPDETGLLYLLNLTGRQPLEYDLINGIEGTWSGTGTHYAYDAEGSLHASDNGYSLYQKSGEDDVQVPYLASGTPIISPTIPGGYTLTRNVPGGGITNLAEALVDFDPDGNGDELITNGDFATNDFTGWSGVNSEWDASTGKAVCDGTQLSGSNFTQLSLKGGTNVLATIDIIVTSGWLKLRFGSVYSDTFTTSGAKVMFKTVDGSGGRNLGVYVSDDFVGSIDNISVKKVIPQQILDRSIALYQTAASRASIWYNSNFPFQYHVNEISDYDVYTTFFESDYIDRFFSKVSDILSISKMFLYATKKVDAALIRVKSYCNISSSSSYEDFTTYTEVDTENRITVAENKLTGVIPETAEAYVYKDFTVDYFDGDYEMQWKINVAASSEAAGCGVLILANDLDDTRALDQASKGMIIRVTGTTAFDWDLKLSLEWQGTSNNVNGLSYATDYYCTITRDDDAGASSKGRYVLTVYSDSGRTSVVGTATVDSNAIQKDWRYLYPMNGYKIGEADIATVIVENLEIISP